MMLSCVITALLVSVFMQSTTAVYSLTDDYSGDAFFQGWDFFTNPDPTHGHVLYQSKSDATTKGLISVQSDPSVNSTKQIFIGVDSTNLASNGRPAVRISTQKTYQHGLILADISHQPGGICGVWPAFWMVGSQWPEMGEIDIVEGVSTQVTNQMTLHTGAGAVLDRTADFSGKLLTSNCDVQAPNQPKNAGCGISDDSNVTFGDDFNAIGGGVFATEWTSSFIKIWFFKRNQIPTDIQRGAPVPSDAWGTPNSLFQGAFNMDDHFKNLSIVVNTAFCGDWAGQIWSETPECAAMAPTCDEYVTNNPKAFDQAFWLINSVKVFEDDGKPLNTSSNHTSIAPVMNSTSTMPMSTSAAAEATVTITMTYTIQSTATQRPQPPTASDDSHSSLPHPTAFDTDISDPAPTSASFAATSSSQPTATNPVSPQPQSDSAISIITTPRLPATDEADTGLPDLKYGFSPRKTGLIKKRRGGAVLPH